MNKYLTTKEHIRESLHLQTLASVSPSSLNIPSMWIPTNTLECFIMNNLVRSAESVRSLLKLLPHIELNFIDKVKNGRADTSTKS